MSECCQVGQGSGIMADDVYGAVPCERCMCSECEHPLSRHVRGYGCSVEIDDTRARTMLCGCEKYQ